MGFRLPIIFWRNGADDGIAARWDFTRKLRLPAGEMSFRLPIVLQRLAMQQAGTTIIKSNRNLFSGCLLLYNRQPENHSRTPSCPRFLPILPTSASSYRAPATPPISAQPPAP
ncbi:hypothetical protein [Kingella sp. (in: b-proteobacteria)]|uniref:hypothetical protein n=1 Tax=Kingella sp. (in: b-proteobacteria) TaxID=2020713 RepID=UPI0026DC300C|nr:hypothetical protein [Kingella sp. (in: b-proteobacteria)]MDO4656504.1 hypothetical protein [Kingella sp. (in: b-proteobacteria)]